jgi:hypothetical protein
VEGVQLARQCTTYGLRVETIAAQRTADTKLWQHPKVVFRHPEEIALSFYKDRGYCGCWCEGGTLNLLMKAACFPVLVRYNSFGERQDARSRYFEAQCTILASRAREILDAISTASLGEVSLAAMEILREPFIHQCYPRVRLEFVLALWKALGAARLAEIARIFLSRPYDYRAGWPDLTLIGSDGLRFVEVKTTDLLQKNQLRVLEMFAKPLALNFSVARVTSRLQSDDN